MVPATLDLATIVSATMHLAKIVHLTMDFASMVPATMGSKWTQQHWTSIIDSQ